MVTPRGLPKAHLLHDFFTPKPKAEPQNCSTSCREPQGSLTILALGGRGEDTADTLDCRHGPQVSVLGPSRLSPFTLCACCKGPLSELMHAASSLPGLCFSARV